MQLSDKYYLYLTAKNLNSCHYILCGKININYCSVGMSKTQFYAFMYSTIVIVVGNIVIYET